MNLELLLWIVAYVIVSEIMFIRHLFRQGTENWIADKILCFIIGAGVIIIQYIIVISSSVGVLESPNYFNLLWELLVLVIIAFLFLVNKLIAENFIRNPIFRRRKFKKWTIKE